MEYIPKKINIFINNNERDYIIKCDNGIVSLSKYDLLLLKLYKGSSKSADIKAVFGEDLDQIDVVFIDVALNYSNLNVFLNFINFPTNKLFKRVHMTYIELMIDAIKRLIDLSCEYALKNGPLIDDLYRSENNKKRGSYFINKYLASFKSTSLIATTAKKLFGKSDTYFIKYCFNDMIPYFDMEKIPIGYMEGESEILLPPFLKTDVDIDRNIIVDEKEIISDFVNIKINCENEESINISEDDLQNAIIYINNNLNNKEKELEYEDYAQIDTVRQYLKNYADQKYKSFINNYNNYYGYGRSSYIK